MKTVRLGILGFGTVGQGISRLLRENGSDIASRTGVQFQISAVGVRDVSRKRDEPCDVLTTDLDSIVDSSEIDLVAEVMGGVEPASALVERALSSGKPVATANKAMVATNGPRLFETARLSGSDLRFESTVCAGIPIIAAIDRQLQANALKSVLGIVNGSTNYILTQMAERGLSMEAAMLEARDRGYLEADPSSDIDGEDAAFKLSILCSVSTRTWVDPQKILRSGIRSIDTRDIEAAAAIGGIYKLTAMATLQSGTVHAAIKPVIVMQSHPFYEVRNERNAVQMELRPVGNLYWSGLGAGGGPTASGVVGDLIELARNRTVPPDWQSAASVARRPSFEGQFAITVDDADPLGIESASRALKPIAIVKSARTERDTIFVTEHVASEILESNLGRLPSVRRVDPVLT